MKADKNVQLGQGFDESSVFRLISNQHGSFSRFMKLYERPQLEARGKTLILDEDTPVALFPSYIPWRRPPGKSRGRRGSRSNHRRVALEWLRCIWGLFNFLEGGSPCSPEAGQHVVTRALSGVWTATHECYARAIFKKLVSYVSHPRETMERGTATLNELISRITDSKYDPSISLEQGLCGAKQVIHPAFLFPKWLRF